jgi:hypothetical protein
MDLDAASMTYETVIGQIPAPSRPPGAPRRKSALCKQADFALDAYRFWCAAARVGQCFHRKHWEFFYICQALHERGLLCNGRFGLGFGVGREPLPALFASFGCTVVATDQGKESAIESGWQQSNQHADDLAALERTDICPTQTFRKLVSFEVVDMNAIPNRLFGRFDFCWSACCFEHLGSIEHGIRFVEFTMKTLKPGGVAVHTTEFNLSSETETLESQGLSIFRRSDIESLIFRLESAGHHVEPLDLNRGTTFIDNYVDFPPYHNEPHLRVRIGDYDCTSIGVIVTRDGSGPKLSG